MNAAASPINFFSAEVLADPFAAYQQAIADHPVHEVPGSGVTMVLSYALVAEATARLDDFSNDFSTILAGARSTDPDVTAILEQGWPQRDTLLTADPPAHTRYRKLVNLAFSMKRVDALEAHMRSIVTGLIDGFIDAGECEFVQAFAMPLPVQMITEQIGIDRTNFATVKRWSDAFADRLGGMVSKERELECAAEVVEFQHAMKAKIDARRQAPCDDLLSDLVSARIEGERPLDDSELLSILQQLMVAGNETTTASLAGGLVQLIRHPGQAAKVRSDPTLTRNMVEEVLRLESPTAGLWRVVKRDTELGGVPLKAGSMLMLRFAAANRDPARFPDPDEFDVERKNANTHLAFGRGIHMCVGNMLSRKELAVAFDELLRRLDRIEIADEGAMTYPANMLLRGLERTADPVHCAVNFSLSEEQELFRATAERFTGSGDVEARKAARAQPGGIDRSRWTQLADIGLLSLEDPVDCAVIAESWGRQVAVEPWLECGYFPLRVLRGSPLADGVMDGSRMASVAFAEPGRRYASDACSTVATPSARGGYTLSGAKTFAVGAALADVLLLTAMVDGETRLFSVDAERAWRRPYTVVDGSTAAEVQLHEVEAERIEWVDWMEATADVRLMAAAEMVGLAQRLLDDTLDYVRQREQFGQPIGRFQAVQHRLVDCYTMVELMRSLLWRTALSHGTPGWEYAVAGAKAFVAERALHVGEEAIQFHGGMGVTDELIVGHAHKRVLLLSRLLGDPASDLQLFARAA